MLPKFLPGKQEGKPVRVQYIIPIMFKLAPTAPNSAQSKEIVKEDQSPKIEEAPTLAEVPRSSENKVFMVVERMPEFPGGEEAMNKFIQKNIVYPDMERSNDIQGRVVVGFVVEKDGSLSDFQIKKSVSTDIDKEAIRVVKLLPKFRPGMQQGKAVRLQYFLPIAFKLAAQKAPKSK
jgi:TonB family protein